MSTEVNLRRAAAIRRHRGKPHVIALLKQRILAAVLRDCPNKEIAAAVELSPTKACKWIHVLGFRQMYVTAAERKLLLARRAESVTASAIVEKEAA